MGYTFTPIVKPKILPRSYQEGTCSEATHYTLTQYPQEGSNTTMTNTLDTAVTDVFERVTDCTFAEVGAGFLEYLLESEHQGWDGTPSKDKAAIARFLQDLKQAFAPGTRTDAMFTGTRYITKDGRPEGEKFPTAKERSGYSKRTTI
jgi:hypothetical protein